MKTPIYQLFKRPKLGQRKWPSRQLEQAPLWCSVDLTHGNNALAKPMSRQSKLYLFNSLCRLGFKQIEVAAPADSDEEYRFVRDLIEQDLIPSDVTIGVVSQMKQGDIKRCFQAVNGAKRAIIHLYHYTSQLSRHELFEQSADKIIERAVNGIEYAQDCAHMLTDTELCFEYTPEGFTTTEPQLVIEVVKQLHARINPKVENPLIVNMEASVERHSPHVFADQVEYFCDNIQGLAHLCLSVNVHNDRGCAVAAAELAQLAGVTRVKGSLFGLGERSGVADIVTLALNLYSTGVIPELDLSNIPQVIADYELTTGRSIPPMHPYAGENAFSAYVSHHQFAINQAFQRYTDQDNSYWHIPYLPMDPTHIGLSNTEVIRLSVHSGRTGIAQVLKKYHGLRLPESMQHEFSDLVKMHAGKVSDELFSDDLWQIFSEHYLNYPGEFELKSIHFEKSEQANAELKCKALIHYKGEACELEGNGKGASDSLVAALTSVFDYDLNIQDYRQHSLGQATDAQAVSYVLLNNGNCSSWGVGIDNDATLATLRAIICALNRSLAKMA